IFGDKNPSRVVSSRWSRSCAEDELVSGVAGALIRLEHAIGPAVSRGQGDVGVEETTFIAIAVRDLRVIDVHELRIVIGRNDASVNVRATNGRDIGSGFVCDALVQILEVPSTDGAVEFGA